MVSDSSINFVSIFNILVRSTLRRKRVRKKEGVLELDVSVKQISVVVQYRWQRAARERAG
jgi:hypothetical protein